MYIGDEQVCMWIWEDGQLAREEKENVTGSQCDKENILTHSDAVVHWGTLGEFPVSNIQHDLGITILTLK